MIVMLIDDTVTMASYEIAKLSRIECIGSTGDCRQEI